MSELTTKDITKVGAGTGKVKTFSRLEAVREFLKDQAKDLILEYRTLAMEAVAQGKPEVAEKILWNLIDSMPKEDGVGIVDSPSSKPPLRDVTSGPAAPTIQIGVMLGGMRPEPLQLPSATTVIDVTPRKGENEVTEVITVPKI